MSKQNPGLLRRSWRFLRRPSARYSLLTLLLAGFFAGIVFWGGAQAWNPRGQRMAASVPMKAGTCVVELDWDDLTPAREFRPTLRDVRPEDLDDLTAR